MNRSIATLLCLCLCLLLASCAPAAVKPGELSADMKTVQHSIHAEDGTQLLTLSYPQWSLTLENQDIAKTIQADLETQIGLWFSPARELEEIARKAYADQATWNPWYAKLEGEVTRLDGQYLSLYFTYTEFCGGMHANQNTYSVTYDCRTGKKLALSALLADSGYLATMINTQLAPLADRLFDDYEAIVGNLLSGDTVRNWYLSSTGLCFHFAPYEIGPFSSGIITVEIPYNQLEGLLRRN